MSRICPQPKRTAYAEPSKGLATQAGPLKQTDPLQPSRTSSTVLMGPALWVSSYGTDLTTLVEQLFPSWRSLNHWHGSEAEHAAQARRTDPDFIRTAMHTSMP